MNIFKDRFSEIKKASEPLYKSPKSVQETIEILKISESGIFEVADGKYEITIYTSCMNASKGIYYYTTYQNHRIMAVDMHREDLEGEALVRYPMKNEEFFGYQN